MKKNQRNAVLFAIGIVALFVIVATATFYIGLLQGKKQKITVPVITNIVDIATSPIVSQEAGAGINQVPLQKYPEPAEDEIDAQVKKLEQEAKKLQDN